MRRDSDPKRKARVACGTRDRDALWASDLASQALRLASQLQHSTFPSICSRLLCFPVLCSLLHITTIYPATRLNLYDMNSRQTKENQASGYHDIHMNTAKSSLYGSSDIHMATSRGTLYPDIRMDTAKPDTTIKKTGLKPWERALVDSPEVRRKATVAQLCK